MRIWELTAPRGSRPSHPISETVAGIAWASGPDFGEREHLIYRPILQFEEGLYSGKQKAVFFSRSTPTCREGEGQARDRTRQDGLHPAFTPAVVLFIALPEAENKTDPG